MAYLKTVELEDTFNAINYAIVNKAEEFDLSIVEKNINSISTLLSNETTEGTTGSTNNQGIFKGRSGIMILWGQAKPLHFRIVLQENYIILM